MFLENLSVEPSNWVRVLSGLRPFALTQVTSEQNLVKYKMNLVLFLFLAILAYLLTPGVLVVLPPGGSKTMGAATHAVILSAVYALTHRFVLNLVK
jgi:hypothetical protein